MDRFSQTVRKALRWGLAAYWCLLFTATHLPPRSLKMVDPFGSGSDKAQHFLGYFGLGLGGVLLLAAHGWLRGRTLALVWAACATYGALDELLQIPVGRSADWQDWLADVSGSGTACLLGAVLILAWPGMFGPSILRRPKDDSPADGE